MNPGVLVVRPVQAGDRSEGARSLVRPSPSLTAMGGEDDAVARSARLAPWAYVAASVPKLAVEERPFGSVDLYRMRS